ncbi:hypothetical protein [Mesorhizobium sp. M0011]|uniref:hypothetical protein n=1 Tax=Mesorhizobium sp. M0011 TaxID=2956839 RepID=UPI003337EF84
MSADAANSKVLALLNREVALEALDALAFALRPEPSTIPLNETAIAFDANVFLRLGSHAKGADIVDYLRTGHGAPVILPGQVIQEFWNNQFTAVDSLAVGIKKRYDQLKADVEKVDGAFGPFADRFSALLDDFQGSYGYIYDEATVRRMDAFLDMLKQKATVPFAPRQLFSHTALLRKKTKTPPGFKDDGDGDFFVWADLLVGLQHALDAGSTFGRVVLVSQEKKIDWNREGTAHPILAAEMKALTGATFEIWPIDRLAREVAP